jgi:hypothetical protein
MNDEIEDLVTIERERLVELEETEQFLRALGAAGVDNWEGYEMAQDIVDDMMMNEFGDQE